ncbi:hypothetical protein NF716_08880, partial [Lactococcus formosensis]|nr:hypothetical protein [Lactococcus formosensis]
VPAGQFLWTKTVWDYTDSTSETGYSVAKMGDNGTDGKDGLGIKSTDITYAISTNSTTPPTSGWTSSVPTLTKGKYLWTRTVWNYTDNSSKTGYSVTYISKDGNDGNDGIAGKDGVGIKLTTITYAKSTSGTTQPTTGWTSTVPTVPAGQFLWTKTVWDYTDSTSETGYSVAKMGDNGTDGKTYYPHTAYAYSADGKEGFTTLYPHLNLEQHTEMLVDDSDKLLYGGKGGATATMTHEYVSIPGLPTVKNAVHITQTTKGQSGWSSQKAYSFPVVAGEEYIFSAYVKNNRTDTLSIGIYCGATADFNGGNPKYFLAFQDVEPSNNFVLITQVIVIPEGYNYAWSYIYTNGTTVNADYEFCGFKVEKGTTATPWMPHESEVTSKDYPTYIGTYTDTYYNGSDDPSKYSWALFRGEDGEKGDSGEPGKVVQQDKEPTERFKDMLWQYTGTEPLDVAGITAQPNMTYVWNGSAWQIWFLNPANLQAVNAWITNAMIANAAIDFAKINSATIENLSAVNSILGDVKAGKITNEFEYDSSVGKTKGTLVIDEIGLRMDYIENDDETRPGSLQVSPSGMTVSRYNTEGLRETASYTQKGMVMSSDVLPMKLSWQGITATVNYERSFDVVYITGRGNWGKFEAGKERSFTGLPESVWPQYEIASGASSMGGAQNMAAKITTDGRIGITSSVSKDNCYAGFSITYRARPNVS